MFRKLEISDIPEILPIMHQDGVRGYNGQFIESENEWFIHFFECEGCYVYGLFDDKLMAVVVAETMSNNGCMLWYIAVHPDHHRKGYGKEILTYFEDLVKKDGIKWIYLTASLNSLEFYKEMNYETAGIHLVEHVKNFL